MVWIPADETSLFLSLRGVFRGQSVCLVLVQVESSQNRGSGVYCWPVFLPLPAVIWQIKGGGWKVSAVGWVILWVILVS